MKTEIVYLSQIQVNGANPRIIKEEKFDKLVNSILVLPKMLELRPIVVDDTFVALGGNMRFRALLAISSMSAEEIAERLSGLRDYHKKTQAEQDNLAAYWERWKAEPTAPIIKASELSEDEQREFIIKDNVGFGEWDFDALANEWDIEDLNEWGADLWQPDAGFGGGGDGTGGDGTKSEPENGSLHDRFVVPPFSILDTRKGYWQARKKMWREAIGDMGGTRNDKLITSPEIKYKDLYLSTRKHREELGIGFGEYLEKYVSDEVKEREAKKVLSQGVSLFDPVLSEICCKWFTPYAGARIFDCFAGDTQKGLVFGSCGFEFTGVELRQEQVDTNNEVLTGRDLPVRYICDDGQNVANHFEPNSQDLLFSCPPYYDLEVYSDNENDASNQPTYADFIQIIRKAFTAALGCLKDNRFAIVVVGDVRDKSTGFYYDFCGDVKQIFRDAGVYLYNEIILVETGASTALRASRYMESRKVGKMHQNVLVFYKGDPHKIKAHFPKIEFTPEDEQAFAAEASEDGAAPDSESDTQAKQEGGDPKPADEHDTLLAELNEFRAPYIKERLIAYEHYPKIKECIANGDIHLERDADTGKIIGYLWMQDLKRKPISRIYEIVSARKGLGRKLVERAVAVKKQPTLQLYVVDYNTNAIEFYQHMGFVEVERETGKKVNNITMEYRGHADAQ